MSRRIERGIMNLRSDLRSMSIKTSPSGLTLYERVTTAQRPPLYEHKNVPRADLRTSGARST